MGVSAVRARKPHDRIAQQLAVPVGAARKIARRRRVGVRRGGRQSEAQGSWVTAGSNQEAIGGPRWARATGLLVRAEHAQRVVCSAHKKPLSFLMVKRGIRVFSQKTSIPLLTIKRSNMGHPPPPGACGGRRRRAGANR